MTSQSKFCSPCLCSLSSLFKNLFTYIYIYMYNSFFNSLPHCRSEIQKGQCKVLAWTTLTCHSLENRWSENDHRITDYRRLEENSGGLLQPPAQNKADLEINFSFKVTSGCSNDLSSFSYLQERGSHGYSGQFLQCLPILNFIPLNIRAEFSLLALISVSVCPFALYYQEDSYSQWMIFSSKLMMY